MDMEDMEDMTDHGGMDMATVTSPIREVEEEDEEAGEAAAAEEEWLWYPGMEGQAGA